MNAAKQVYMQDGRNFAPADPASLNIVEKLPVGTYSVSSTPAGYVLTKVPDFELEGKLYGNVNSHAERILTTANSRKTNTGVLLSGDKGCGKTMLTKRISQLGREKYGAITILVNGAYCGNSFNSFIQSIDQPCIVLFDEFEKVYGSEEQERLLTIFDGTASSQKLMLLTCNERHRINRYMLNRPGRLYYSLEYKGLDADFVREYCADNLDNKDNINGVVVASQCFYSFSFDMLKALVEEMNRYNETATEAIRMLNMKPANSDGNGTYDITILRNGVPLKYHSGDKTMKGNPMSSHGNVIEIYAPEDEDDLEEAQENGELTEDESFVLDVNKIISVDPDNGKVTFQTERPDTIIVFTRQVQNVPLYDFDRF